MDHEEASAQACYEAARAVEFRDECCEIAAEIANDEQEIMAFVEEKMLKWAGRGWLELNCSSWELDSSTGRYVRTSERRTALKASAYVAECVKDALADALSLTAQEALEVASERR